MRGNICLFSNSWPCCCNADAILRVTEREWRQLEHISQICEIAPAALNDFNTSDEMRPAYWSKPLLMILKSGHGQEYDVPLIWREWPVWPIMEDSLPEFETSMMQTNHKFLNEASDQAFFGTVINVYDDCSLIGIEIEDRRGRTYASTKALGIFNDSARLRNIFRLPHDWFGLCSFWAGKCGYYTADSLPGIFS